MMIYVAKILICNINEWSCKKVAFSFGSNRQIFIPNPVNGIKPLAALCHLRAWLALTV